MRKNIQSILTVSASTLGSRILGLFRDILIYAQMGLGPTTSAFLLAFTIPNLFRRLFGEGALSAALIPVFAEEDARAGHSRAFDLLNRTLSRVLLVLVPLCLVVAIPAAVCLSFGWVDEDRYGEALRLGLLLFPYVVPICLAALIAGALQTCGRFFTPAITPVILNISMIAFLAGPGIWLADGVFEKALWLSVGVLVGGFLQLALPAVDLGRRGWRPRLNLRTDPAIEKVQRLFVPAVAGAAILQVNILVSRSLAFWVDADGVALLYLPARLVELPLGLFGIATATVLFPEFARLAGRNDPDALLESYRNGAALVAAIMIPAAVGLGVLAEPILRVFAWGLFDAADAAKAAPVLLVFGLGLPFYALATLLSRAHQARQDMRTPVRVAARVLAANLVFSLALMFPFGVAGLAAANSIAAAIQVCLLQRALRVNMAHSVSTGTGSPCDSSGPPANPPATGSMTPPGLWKVLAGSGVLLVFLWFIPHPPDESGRSALLIHLFWVVPAGGVVALGTMAALGFKPVRALLPRFHARHGS